MRRSVPLRSHTQTRRRNCIVFLIIAGWGLTGCSRHSPQQMKSDAALSGTVSSAAEAKMEGVLVSAKREGSRITVTVVSDREGHFEFPASRMPAGHYGLRIRAVGYELDQSDSVEIVAGSHTEQNIALRPSSNRADQLTSAEWLMSVPGNDKQKDVLYRCVSCHELGPVMERR